jgi:predicted transcriptional regulator
MRKVREKAPDFAEEAAYELYVRQKIAAGLKAADEGRVVPHEEVKRRFLSA